MYVHKKLIGAVFLKDGINTKTENEENDELF
jgi:hypothetical protein